MGCASSKQASRARSRSLKNRIRSHSLPFQNDGRPRAGGKLPERRLEQRCIDEEMMKSMTDAPMAAIDGRKETGHVVMWPEKTEQRKAVKSPKTSKRDAEVINVWEIMDGLEDGSKLESASGVDHYRRCRTMMNPDISGESSLKSRPTAAAAGAHHLNSDFRPEISSSFRKALRKPSPQHRSPPSPGSEVLVASSSPNAPPADPFDSEIDPDFLCAFEQAINEPSMELQHQPRPSPDYKLRDGVPPLPDSPPMDSVTPYFDREFMSAFESALTEASTLPRQSLSPLRSPRESSRNLGFDPEILAAFNKTVNETTPPYQSISSLHSPATGSISFDFEPEVLSALKTSPPHQTSLLQHTQPGSISFDFEPEVLSAFKTSPPHQPWSSQHTQPGSISFDFEPELLAAFKTSPPHQPSSLQQTQPGSNAVDFEPEVLSAFKTSLPHQPSSLQHTQPSSISFDIEPEVLSAFKTSPPRQPSSLQHTQPGSISFDFEPEILSAFKTSPPHQPSSLQQTQPGSISLDFEPEVLSAFKTSSPHQSSSLQHTQPGYISFDIEPEILSAFKTSPPHQPSSLQHTKPGSDAVDFGPEVLSAFKTSSPHQASSLQDTQPCSDAVDVDPEILAAFEKAFNETSPQDSTTEPPMSDKNDDDKEPEDGSDQAASSNGIVEARIKEFQQKIDARKKRSKANRQEVPTSPYRAPSAGDHKVVFYFTSIRGIRKTFEECLAVRLILRGTGVRIDERDVSMHVGYKEELNALLGPPTGVHNLPRVFIDGKYLGGAEEVRSLHDAGTLGELLKSCKTAPEEGASCERCGDIRFILCERCSGSCKVHVEDDDDFEEEEGGGERHEEEGKQAGMRRCPDCNENGLVRCSLCC